ncbi:MAG TPA: alanine racemase [Jiangellaceae bacterium]
MPLTLHIDARRWRDHVHAYVKGTGDPGSPSVVPVAKGNGYGFGNAVLATEAAAAGASTLAVGTHDEVAEVSDAFPGDLLVLAPWHASSGVPTDDDRVVHTVSDLEALRALSEAEHRPRVVVEVLTSMRRHGIEADRLPDVASLIDRVRFEGFALHLPLAGRHLDEAHTLGVRAIAAAESAGWRERTLWVSHLSPADAAELARRTSTDVRLRVATALWLGERAALRPTATVVDVQPVRRGERYGYRQRRAPRDGTVLVMSGGTAHGIALEAPTPAATPRQRAVSLAKGGLDALGRSLSPFTVAGKQRWFAEPPHMQVSMVWLPGSVTAPARGDEIGVEVRFTTTSFDRLAWE